MLIHNTNHENENCFWGLSRAMQFESISIYRSVARCTRVTLRITCLPGCWILALAMPGDALADLPATVGWQSLRAT